MAKKWDIPRLIFWIFKTFQFELKSRLGKANLLFGFIAFLSWFASITTGWHIIFDKTISSTGWHFDLHVNDDVPVFVDGLIVAFGFALCFGVMGWLEETGRIGIKDWK